MRETLADLDAIRAHMNLESWTLAGHSFGAILGMAYAIHYPKRLASLVLMNSGPIRYASAAVEMENVTMRLTPDERTALQGTAHANFGRTLDIILPGYLFDRSNAPAAALQLRPEKYHPEISSLLGSDVMPPGAGLRPALKDFLKPVLVIAGRQDPLDPAVQYEIHLALENSTLRLLERCGHFSWIEQPEEFYQSIRDFLR
jgi:proline iminopeptidase